MPFQPIPPTSWAFDGSGVGRAPPQQGDVVQQTWPLSVEYPPQPGEHYELSSFNLPVYVAAQAVAAQPAPTVCYLTPQIFLSGTVAFQEQLTVPLGPVHGGPWLGGAGSVSVIASTPIAFYPGQTLTMAFQAMFDQATSIALVVLAGVAGQPFTTLDQIQTTPGSLGYIIVPDI